MDGEYSVYRGDEKYIYNFDSEAWSDDTTQKT
jgi:hypothetical protein